MEQTLLLFLFKSTIVVNNNNIINLYMKEKSGTAITSNCTGENIYMK